MNELIRTSKTHYKKIIALPTGALLIYVFKKFFKKCNDKKIKKPEDTSNESIVENENKSISLRELLIEIAESSDDEIKQLTSSVFKLYEKQNPTF